MANDPRRAGDLALVAGADIVLAAIACLAPWTRAQPDMPAVLALPGFAVLGFSTWAFGGVAAGTGPFLVLLYTWAALHFSRWVLIALTVPATAAYLTPLLVTGQPPVVTSSALILLPVALAVALLIEAQARHLRDDRERLARIEQWRAALIGALAHDVRSPLATVQLTLEELQEGAGGRTARLLDGALRQTSRISRLAAGLLDLNRIDSTGRIKLDLQRLPARQAVQDALWYVKAEGVKLEIDDDLSLYVDKDRFEQVVINLVSNALRYGRPPVIVRISRDGVTDRLEVRDHGAGVADDLRTRLFTRFGVGDGDGVGLGLWIVRQLAAAHGGEVRYEAADPGARMVATFRSAQAGEGPCGTNDTLPDPASQG